MDRHDFDFLYGHWKVHNRRLKERLAGSNEWQEFGATQECWPILGGYGNVDAFHPGADAPFAFEGASVRIFDPASGEWSIYWADTVRNRLEFNVKGRFEGGRGTFLGEDEHLGRKWPLRFQWDTTISEGPRWEQAYFDDRSGVWETNWIMTFTRLP
jgi:hypothetical protein